MDQTTISRRVIWNALVYATALFYLGVAWWKALIIALIVFVSTSINFGAKQLTQIGAVLMVVALAVWIGVLPAPATWKDSAKSWFAAIRADISTYVTKARNTESMANY